LGDAVVIRKGLPDLKRESIEGAYDTAKIVSELAFIHPPKLH
jgi:hypothetical protein